jgi:DNA-binding NarL/FixJ family response regulator
MNQLILVVDDEPKISKLARDYLEKSGFGVVTAVDGQTALTTFRHEKPDLVVLDLNLPGMDGLHGLARLREASPATPVAILSATDDREHVHQALALGAAGYIPKSAGSDVILNAIRLVLAGGVYLPVSLVQPDSAEPPETELNGSSDVSHGLTPRQHEVLELLTQGLSNKQIARRLDVAENTVRVHVAAILRLLGASNRTEAGYRALRLGLVTA